MTVPAEESAAELCPSCNGSGWVTRRVHVGHPEFGQAVPCVCQGTQDASTRLASLRRYSNLGALSRISFDSTEVDSLLDWDPANSQAFANGLATAKSYAENPESWLVLTGPSRSGKTHLAAAIANRSIERQQTTFFILAADLLDHLRSTYSPDSPVTYDELFEQVRNVPLLVLDDLGVQSPTPWAQEKLFQVINHRYNNNLATVITVRGPIQRLDESLRTRLVHGPSRVVQLGHFNAHVELGIGEVPAGMLGRMTFQGFDTQGGKGATPIQKESLDSALRFAMGFAGNPIRWLVFSGDPGSGKTHLAVAVAGASLSQDSATIGASLSQDRPVFFAFVPTLLDHLRATFRPDSLIGYDELFDQINTVPLLVLDDLGAETSTSWAEEKLYQIVVHRHEARLPTIITTTLNIEEIGQSKPRIASRLVDTAVVNWVPFTAPNYRQYGRDRS